MRFESFRITCDILEGTHRMCAIIILCFIRLGYEVFTLERKEEEKIPGKSISRDITSHLYCSIVSDAKLEFRSILRCKLNLIR